MQKNLKNQSALPIETTKITIEIFERTSIQSSIDFASFYKEERILTLDKAHSKKLLLNNLTLTSNLQHLSVRSDVNSIAFLSSFFLN